MGEFDDVLAMEPGDEWENHVVGEAADAAVTHGRLQATLRLPNALVELRGSAPAGVVEVLSDLTDERLELLGDAPTLRLTVAHDGDRWSIDGAGASGTVDGDDEHLARALVEQLDRLAVDTDPMRLHLAVACVQLDGRGVVLVAERSRGGAVDSGTIGDTESIGGSAAGDRAAGDELTLVVAELLELGADFVTTGLLSLLPGSRTVFGHPSPPSTSTHPPVRASMAAPVVPVTRIDHVVVLGGAGDSGATDDRDLADAVIALLGAALDADRLGPASLDVITQAVSAATCSRVARADPAATAAAVSSAVSTSTPPRPARLCTVHRFDVDGNGQVDRSEVGPTGEPVPAAVQRAKRSLRVARLGTSGVLLDGATGTTVVVTTEELDALEDLLVTTAKPTHHAALARLADMGIRVPTGRSARSVPGVESYGLPNCPAGTVAATMWSGDTVRATLAAASEPGADVPGAVAQAVERGAVVPAPAEQGAILDRHALARQVVAVVESTLSDVLDVAERHDVVPLVLGSGGLAHDGPLPEDFTDAEQVDLLLQPDSLSVLAEALSTAGYGVVDTGPSDGSDTPTVLELVSTGEVPVTVRLRARLAVGPFAALVNHEEFHDRSVPVHIGGRWCRTLHPEHRFVLTCVQLDLDATDSTVQDLRDVVLSAPRIEAHMAAALEASERWGAVGSVLTSLRRVQAVMPGLSPWLVERAERDEGRRSRRSDRGDRPARGLRRLRRS